jgi:tryptophan 2,3-dioxygenase
MKNDEARSTAALAAGAHTDFAKQMNYGDYLRLDTLLSAQKPLSGSHDEMLFIIIHQATELWMKLALHELEAARGLVRTDQLQPAFKCLARVSRIQSQLIQSWDVLSTMTPSDFSSFRDKLGQSSGFQSVQYRLIEFLLGNRQAYHIAAHQERPDSLAQLQAALGAPSLYDEVIRLLHRRGLEIDAAVLDRDIRRAHSADASVAAAWLKIYRDPAKYWDLYQLAEELVDLEDWFQQWRYRHVSTVRRIIGMKRGTGGTAGVNYLRGALDIVFFPELWSVRTEL